MDGLLRRARQHAGLDTEGLAAKLGVNRTSVSDAERRGPATSVGLLERYGAAMGLELVIQYVAEDGTIIR